MTTKNIKLKKKSEGICFLLLDRSAQRNALSLKMLTELEESLEQIKADNSLRCLIIADQAQKSFCAGADLKERINFSDDDTINFINRLGQFFCRLEKLPVPTIAAIDGYALGGGLEMALSCDLRVAHHEACLGLPETRLAIIPGAGGTQRLAKIVGVARAKELIFLAQKVSAQKAYEYGLVNFIAHEQSACDFAFEVARQINSNGPWALTLAKQAVNFSFDQDLSSALSYEQECYKKLLTSVDRKEALLAFKEKRSPKFVGQ